MCFYNSYTLSEWCLTRRLRPMSRKIKNGPNRTKLPSEAKPRMINCDMGLWALYFYGPGSYTIFLRQWLENTSLPDVPLQITFCSHAIFVYRNNTVYSDDHLTLLVFPKKAKFRTKRKTPHIYWQILDATIIIIWLSIYFWVFSNGWIFKNL